MIMKIAFQLIFLVGVYSAPWGPQTPSKTPVHVKNFRLHVLAIGRTLVSGQEMLRKVEDEINHGFLREVGESTDGKLSFVQDSHAVRVFDGNEMCNIGDLVEFALQPQSYTYDIYKNINVLEGDVFVFLLDWDCPNQLGSAKACYEENRQSCAMLLDSEVTHYSSAQFHTHLKKTFVHEAGHIAGAAHSQGSSGYKYGDGSCVMGSGPDTFGAVAAHKVLNILPLYTMIEGEWKGGNYISVKDMSQNLERSFVVLQSSRGTWYLQYKTAGCSKKWENRYCTGLQIKKLRGPQSPSGQFGSRHVTTIPLGSSYTIRDGPQAIAVIEFETVYVHNNNRYAWVFVDF